MVLLDLTSVPNVIDVNTTRKKKLIKKPVAGAKAPKYYYAEKTYAFQIVGIYTSGKQQEDFETFLMSKEEFTLDLEDGTTPVTVKVQDYSAVSLPYGRFKQFQLALVEVESG